MVQVGKTPLIPLKEILPGTLFENAYIKDEGQNPFQSIKDRRNSMIVHDATRIGVDKLVLITSGNNGHSLASLAKGFPLVVVCIVDRNIHKDVKALLQKIAHQVIEVNLQHKILRTEEVISFAREKSEEVIWDVTNGYEQAYTTIIAELRRVKPDFIITPVGSGENFVGLVNGVELYHIPTKVIGVGVQSQTYSVADKLYSPWTPYGKAMTMMQKRGHIIYSLTEDEIRQSYNKMKDHLTCEPSSAVVFGALEKHPFSMSDRIVLINSGRLPIPNTFSIDS